MDRLIASKIAVVGLGLMGGSLALSLSRAGFEVAGWDPDRAAIEEAVRIGAIEGAPETLAEAVSGARVVFVAAPVEYIPEIIAACLPFTEPGTIFSDLGSIKQIIVERVFSFLPETHYFVPGHPMTGSEQHGIAAADPFLFQNAAYILIRCEPTPEAAVRTVEAIIGHTGAHLLTLRADEHDRIVGMVSHLPHLVAATLAKTAGNEEEAAPRTLDLAAGGFRDTTRVALGAPQLWAGIIRGNQRMVLRALDAFAEQFRVLRELVAGEDWPGLQQFLNQSREIRAQVPSKNKGFLTLLHEMVVTIEDRPGAIHEVLIYLAEVGVNIKDIEILRVREGDGGTLRLALENEPALEQALSILAQKGFKVKKR
jgi:prephenate dehydrogenase